MNILRAIAKRALQVLGLLMILYALFLVIVALVPCIKAPEQPLAITSKNPTAAKTPHGGKDVSFTVEGTDVKGWLYLPKNAGQSGTGVPCVIMAHGLGGTMSMGLDRYGRRFADAGCAALIFDYRYFGLSGGEPRHLIWIPDQLADYRGAVRYARSLKEIDPDKIALWGTSFSGGHVIVLASEDKRIACVSSQCPGLDGREAMEHMAKGMDYKHGFAMIVHGLRDLVRSWLGLAPHVIPMLGNPGTIAIYTNEEEVDFFRSMMPADYPNRACARIIVRGDKYRPITYAREITCPVLLQICENDKLLPLTATEETAKILGTKAEVKRYPIGHFDIYRGRHFDRAVADQIAFFKKHLVRSNP